MPLNPWVIASQLAEGDLKPVGDGEAGVAARQDVVGRGYEQVNFRRCPPTSSQDKRDDEEEAGSANQDEDNCQRENEDEDLLEHRTLPSV